MIWLVIALQLVTIVVIVWPINPRRRGDAMAQPFGDQPVLPPSQRVPR